MTRPARRGEFVAVKRAQRVWSAGGELTEHVAWRLLRVVRATREGLVTHVAGAAEFECARATRGWEVDGVVYTLGGHARNARLAELTRNYATAETLRLAVLSVAEVAA